LTTVFKTVNIIPLTTVFMTAPSPLLRFFTIDSCIQAARAMDYNRLHKCCEAGIVLNEKVVEAGIETGSADLIEWILGKGGNWTIEQSNHAARLGKMRIIKWAISNGLPLSDATAAAAAYANHPDIVKTLHEGGVKLSSFAIAAGAAQHGNLEFLKWIKENNGVVDDMVLFNSLNHDHFDVADWAHENGVRWGDGHASYFWLSDAMRTKLRKYRS